MGFLLLSTSASIEARPHTSLSRLEHPGLSGHSSTRARLAPIWARTLGSTPVDGAHRWAGADGCWRLEPHPVAYESLLASLRHSGVAERVTATTDRDDTDRAGRTGAPLYLSSESELSSLVLTVDDVIDAPAETLDVLAGQLGFQHFEFVKIDVEDADEEVVAGASGLLTRRAIDALFIEMRCGQGAQPLLERHGYAGYLVVENDVLLTPISGVEPGHFADYLFLSPGKPELVARLPFA